MNERDEAINPGLVVLSSSLQCLHLNRRAVTLLTQLERSGSRAAVIAPCEACQVAPIPPEGWRLH